MREENITFTSSGYNLAGTIALPEGEAPFPAAVLISGSGMIDRDENHSKMKINVMREVATCLAAEGIATLRYDKRGVGESGGDYWVTGYYDNAADARAAVDYLAAHPGIRKDKIYLLGHSEGAIISTHLAGQEAPVAGVILLSGTAQPGEKVLEWQGRQVAKTLKGPAAWLIKLLRIDVGKTQRKSIEKIKRTTADTTRMQLIARVNAKWMREFFDYDPAADLPRIRVPILAITGAKDIQTDPADLTKMKGMVEAPFESHVIPDMSHILRRDPEAPGLGHYKKQIRQPVDAELLDIIAAWLKRQTGE